MTFRLSCLAKSFICCAVLICVNTAVFATVTAKVMEESEVFLLTPPDNGSGPLWSYGCTQIARLGEDVYISAMETDPDTPPLCNTKWRLLKHSPEGWKMISEDTAVRQREPCPLAVISPDRLAINVNDSLEPKGTKYGRCLPGIRLFHFSDAPHTMTHILPQWKDAPYFTDHSYRSFASDPVNHRLLMFNIDAKTSVEHACLLSADGETLATSSVSFPIRSCYAQTALHDFAAYMLAIGDIVEPVDAWREYKFEQTERQWDYVFRRLFYTWRPDIRTTPFADALEIDTVDDTAGYITNQDLWIDSDGTAWILYIRFEVQNALLRDKFFPDKSIDPSLILAQIDPNGTVHKEVLVPESPERGISQAKFQVSAKGHLYAVICLSGEEGGVNIMPLHAHAPDRNLIPVPLEHPLGSFCLATTRAGNAPSNWIDMFGTTGDNQFRYTSILLEEE
ncbi:MAG: hypothetical protein GX117_02865 [Candidatus Hydrogenedentes bacterium]|nr:hypothetical protein [Candidatus Hydrogenedentota bacterium]